jgi:hypothetical protein
MKQGERIEEKVKEVRSWEKEIQAKGTKEIGK